jgi:hypothetical protein
MKGRLSPGRFLEFPTTICSSRRAHFLSKAGLEALGPCQGPESSFGLPQTRSGRAKGEREREREKRNRAFSDLGAYFWKN